MKASALLAAFGMLACAVPIAGCLPTPEVKTTLVIVGGEFIASEDAEPVRDAVILIEGDVIATVDPQSLARFPKGVEKVDARGKWIVPGHMNAEAITIFPKPTQSAERPKANLLIFSGNPVSPDYELAPPDYVIENGRVTMESDSRSRQL